MMEGSGFETVPGAAGMGVENSVEDSPSQRWGRALIIVGGLPLVFLIGNSSVKVPDPDGSRAWWTAVLVIAFDVETFGLVSWVLLGLFGLGIALNLWGLRPAIAGFRCSIRWIMGVVAVAAGSFFVFRLFPKVGLVMILMAAMAPASAVRSTRRHAALAGVPRCPRRERP